jgi:alkanesulfonate monooxygenase SsuD/methylene tetrahydromethanopterin reductase-like flavin-dependent oxidoreductase (luciferase family)
VQFGISLVVSGLRGETMAAMVEERIAMVRVAHAAGYDLVSAGQHFCASDMLMPQPIPLLARLAAEAPGMAMQTGVILGPFYNPVVLAEEAALLGAITGNRFRAAIGLGYRDDEFAIFGQRRQDRLKRVIELVTITRRLLRNETVTTDDGFYPLESVALTPGSVGDTPPRLMIGTGTEKGAARAGRIADGLYVTGYLPPSDVERLVRTYRAAADAAAADLPPLVTIRREVTVATSRKAALAQSVPGWIGTLSSYLSEGLETRALADIVDDLKAHGDSPDLPFIVGNPEECAEQIRWYEAMGVNEIVIRFDLRDGTHAATLEAIEQFGAEVIPLVRAG